MNLCNWVQFAHDSWVDVLIYGVFEEEHSFPLLEICKPSVVTLVGRNNNHPAGIQASLENCDGHPVILSSLQPFDWDVTELQSLREKKRFRLIGDKPKPNAFLKQICYNFSDVICISSRNLEAAAVEVRSWIEDCMICNTLGRPIAVILVDHELDKLQDPVSELGILCADIDIRQYFANIVIRQRNLQMQNNIDVCKYLLPYVEISRQRREDMQHLWNFRTLITLFEKSCAFFARACDAGFNFVHALRENAWPGPALQSKSLLVEWLKLSDGTRTLLGFVSPVIARVLVEDSQKIEHGLFSLKE
jgi:hypothetical protein